MHMLAAERGWLARKEVQDAIIQAYLEDNDTEEVMRARLFGLGLRGDYLQSEVLQAQARKATRYPERKMISMIMVMEYGRLTEYFRFKDPASANFAVKLLQKQPNVMMACRTTDFPVP